MKKICMLLALALIIALVLPRGAKALQAQDITDSTDISGIGYSDFGFLKDGNIDSYRSSEAGCVLTLENPQGIASLYLYFDLEYGAYTITDNGSGATMTGGSYGILHEFVDLAGGFGSAPVSVTLHFENGVRLSELYAFSQGQTPDFVQKWTAPLEEGADIVLFSAHSDDDQLFFAGLVPLYAGARGCRVQVVLMTDHREGSFATNARTHEVLNGLWATGLTAYPVFGKFWDYRIDDLEGMYQYYAQRGVTRDDLQSYVVENLRRFKPLVAIGHDLGGEYGHGMHMIYAQLLANGVALAADPNAYPASAQEYGVWQTQKTYLHLYEENQIVLDYDQPLERFGGLTAFQASQKLGYPNHYSQAWTWFTQWINGEQGEITSVTQITDYNPAHFGLYATTVGPDVQKNDFLENIVTYAQQDQNAADGVDALIQALGEITPDSEAAINQVREAYDALTLAQKALVTGLDILEAAESSLETLKQAQVADREAARQVMEKIDGLGVITLDSAAALEEAWAAYGDLTEAQRALVTNLGKLEAAGEELRRLQTEAAERPQQPTNPTEPTPGQGMQELTSLLWVLAGLVAALVIALLMLVSRRPQRRRNKR